MDLRPLVEGRIANLGKFLDFLSFCVLDDFFPFVKLIGFGGILGPPYYGIGATICIERCFVFCMRYFSKLKII